MTDIRTRRGYRNFLTGTNTASILAARLWRSAGVDKKALLESLRLTGNEERGEREAEITIRFFSADRESSTARRRMYLNDRVLENLAVGRYVNIRMVPEKKNLFAFVVPANHICPM